MKAWGRATLLLTLAVVLAVVLRQHGGNVLIVAPPWRVELSLTLAVILIAVLFFLLYGLLRGVQWLTQGPQRVRHWRGQRAQRKDRASLEQGWIGVLEGRSHEAEQQLSRLLARTRAPETKVLAALALARAQHEDGRLRERDETLMQAHTAAAGQARLREAVAVVHAELLLAQNRAQAALQLLQTFLGETPKALNATKLLLQAWWQLAQYAKVFELARLLQRKGALKPEQARPYLEKAAVERLAALMDVDAAAFKTGFKVLWNDLKREEKLWPAVALQAATLQARHDETRESGKILEAALVHGMHEKQLDAKLLDAWSRCAPEAIAQRVAKAEDWLKTSPDHVDLLMTLGKLCLQGQLWGAAERYLQRSLKLSATADAAVRQTIRIHALLGRLHDSLGHLEQALHHWRLAAGADAELTPRQRSSVLPAADVRDDPGSMDTVGNDKSLRSAQAAALASPLAASAADYELESVPEGSRATFRGKSFADETPFANALEPAMIDDLYFDSAVIPGVDLSQTSDQSGAYRADAAHA